MVHGAKFKEWYEENKYALSERRKKKYQEDAEFRGKKRLASKRYYWLKKRRAVPLKKMNVDLSAIEPDEIATVIISNENDIRCGLEVEIPMYYPGTVSSLLRRSVQTLRLWALRGYIPETTYRNLLNYRLYTEDQLKVYIKHAHLLKMTVKDFKNHPYFVAVRNGLEKLEPDGIKVMPLDQWRFSDEKCIWCRGDYGLEYFDNFKWVKVPCFECIKPYNIEERIDVKEKEVFGRCNFCYKDVSKNMFITRGDVVLVCPYCNRRIPKISIK